MILIAGDGSGSAALSNLLTDIPYNLSHGVIGISGGALAATALACRGSDKLLPVLDELFGLSSIIDILRLTGSNNKKNIIDQWITETTGLSQMKFKEWTAPSRQFFQIVAYNCEDQIPTIFSPLTTPNVCVSDAIAASIAWPLVTNCHEILGVAYCNIEYVIPVSALEEFISPRCFLIVQTSTQKLACRSTVSTSLETWCSVVEYYNSFVMKHETCRNATVEIDGPNLMDSFFSLASQSLSDYCFYEQILYKKNGVPLILLTCAISHVYSAQTKLNSFLLTK